MMNLHVKLPPDTMQVEIAFYDDTHREDLLASAAASVFLELDLPQVIEIPTVEFLTYYLFYKKRPGSVGFSSYKDIKKNYGDALAELRGQLKFENGTLRVGSHSLSRATTERLGEAIGLSVISNLHRLIEADWNKIPETNFRKTFDYEYVASDGNLVIATEAKGSINEKNREKTSSISQHKASILEKKKSARTQQSSPGTILYGTIAVLDHSDDSVPRCWILDPPILFEAEPKSLRIIARMSAISDLVSFLSPRSQLASALKSRVEALIAVQDVFSLDTASLKRGNGDVFSVKTRSQAGQHNPWLSSKSRVADEPVGGQVFQVSPTLVLFIGLQEELLVMAITQDLKTISQYRFDSGVAREVVACQVSLGRYKKEFQLPEYIESVESNGYVAFELEGNLFYSSSGLVFGLLPLTEIRR